MFALFPKLPPELRAEVWKHALQSCVDEQPTDRRRLCMHKEGCWDLNQPLMSCDSDDSDDYGTLSQLYHNLKHDIYCHESLTLPIEMPLFFVNQEARQTVLLWSHKGIARPHQKEAVTFHRYMELDDTIYITMKEFEQEYQALSRGSVETGVVNIPNIPFTNFAVPEEFFLNDEQVPDILRWFDEVTTIYVIVGEQPDETGRWEVVPKGSGSVVWKPNRGLELRNGKSGKVEGVLHNIMRDTKQLVPALYFAHGEFDNEDWTVEIIPALAVQK